MIAEGLLEISKGIGKLFINPLFYWIIILFFAIGYKRIKQERDQFGTKIFPLLHEGKNTILVSFVSSIAISSLAVIFGLFFTDELILIWMIVIILLSLTASVNLLSASYTIGMMFLLGLFLSSSSTISFDQYINVQASLKFEHFVTLAFLTGIFLLIEAILVMSKKSPSYPALKYSERGSWIGEHHIKRLAFIPFIVLIPVSSSIFVFPLFPYFNIGEETYSLLLLPFIIGFDYKIHSALPERAKRQIGQATLLLGLLVLGCSIASVYYPILTLAAIIIAVVGKEWITYALKRQQRMKTSVFHALDKGVKVLATIPNSPADRLGISVGETILRVNGKMIQRSDQFYEALQNSGAFFKLDIVDVNGEVRFIRSAFYAEDHYTLGVVFVEEAYRAK